MPSANFISQEPSSVYHSRTMAYLLRGKEVDPSALSLVPVSRPVAHRNRLPVLARGFRQVLYTRYPFLGP